MTSVFNKVHRLKQQPGWTWDRFLGEIDRLSESGIDEKTLYSHFRQPHKKANAHTKRLIDQLHDTYFSNPFPADINGLMSLYNNLSACRSHKSKTADIEHLEDFLSVQLNREDPGAFLRIARINWLLGNIQFDRIPTFRDNGQAKQLTDSKEQAIGCYQRSVENIERYNQHHPETSVGPSYLYRAQHNILACYLNAVPQDRRDRDPSIIRYLTESNFISASKQALEDEPFQWSIARNGLRFSSMVKNADDADYFFQALVKVSQQFLDLDYKPLNYGPINSGKDFTWAIENVLTDEYLRGFEV